jgi:flagellar motor switch protein FliG
MPFKGGPEEAAKMLAGLDSAQQKKVLSEIEKQNPRMAQMLREKMVTFEDLIFITQMMLMDLLKEVKAEQLALALRLGSSDLQGHILKNVSVRMRRDMEEVLKGPPKRASEVQEVQSKIMEIVRLKVDQGVLILKKQSEMI